MPRRFALPALAVLLISIAVTTGCGKSSTQPVTNQPPPTLPPGTPQNTSPQAAMLRFEAAYEYQALAEYAALFTADFRFAFSSDADPQLVSQFPDTWGKGNEIQSTSHLFDGFTNSEGQSLPPASLITLTLNGPQIIADPDYPDSAAFYAYMIVPSIRLELEISNTDGFTMQVPHDFYLVRGDAAVLDSSQPADSVHWYIRRWVDKSPPLASVGRPGTEPARFMPANPSTWGKVKATYWR
jgi:hypothetical protein